MMAYAITTEDNPVNPLDDYYEWFKFDCLLNNYNTPALLDRAAITSDKLSDEENSLIISRAIDNIIAHVPDPNGKPYIKVSQDIDEDVYGT